MPPEQARGADVDERADVYALGALLYHALAGHAPYSGETSATIIDRVIAGPPAPIGASKARVSPDLIAIVAKAMAREPGDRYATAAALADDLRRFQTGQLVGAHRYSRSTLLWRWARRNRAALLVAVSLLLVLAAATSGCRPSAAPRFFVAWRIRTGASFVSTSPRSSGWAGCSARRASSSSA